MMKVINIDSGTLINVINVNLPFIKKTVIMRTITIVACSNEEVTLANHSLINRSCLNNSVFKATSSGNDHFNSFITSSICALISRVLIPGCFTIRNIVHGLPFTLASHLRLGSGPNVTFATCDSSIGHASRSHTMSDSISLVSVVLPINLMGAS